MNNWVSSSPRPELQMKMYSEFIGGDTFEEYVKNEELEKLIVGKTIALVGPSTNLEGSGMGSKIDSFDIVVRPGQLNEIPKEKHNDYGNKIDIVTHSFNVWERELALKNIDFLKERKFVVGTMVHIDHKLMYENFESELLNNHVKFHKPSDRYIYKLFDEIGTTPNCGFISLIILLNYDIKSIYVTGMDFYNMGKYGRVYRDDYFDNVTKNSHGYLSYNEEKIINARQARFDLHDQKTQIEFLKQLILIEKRIVLDDYLKENLI